MTVQKSVYVLSQGYVCSDFVEIIDVSRLGVLTGRFNMFNDCFVDTVLCWCLLATDMSITPFFTGPAGLAVF